MINENQLEETVKQLFDEIQFAAEPAGLYDPLRYMIEIGGKRVRPRLCLLTYSLFKDELDDSVLEPAAGLEIFHSFTLAHDDIMDNSSMRRGKPTVCSKWNDNTAILSGDVMCIDSYKRIAKAPASVLPQVLELFSTTATEICEGQQLDMDYEDRGQVSMEEYNKMIGLKTAVLIACSAKMGALIAGAGEHACSLLYDFGYDLGLAFQITDDYLDTFGDSDTFGKAIGGDIANNKKTWLLTRALEKSSCMEQAGVVPEGCSRQDILDAMAMPCDSTASRDAKYERVRGIYEALGVDEDAKYEIIRLHAQAMNNVGLIGLSKVRYEMLHRYADRLIGRNR